MFLARKKKSTLVYSNRHPNRVAIVLPLGGTATSREILETSGNVWAHSGGIIALGVRPSGALLGRLAAHGSR